MSERPSRFFKYRSMDAVSLPWVRKTVLEHEIYFAPASRFNDPFDLRPVITLDATPQQHRERYLASSRRHEPHLPEHERQAQADAAMSASMSPEEINRTAGLIQARLGEAITTQCGVYCVSSRGDDILMWSHYGDFHRGICLVFDGDGPLMAHAHPVRYVEERVALNQYTDDAQTMVRKALLTKSSHWAYENEWRLLMYDPGPGTVSFRPFNLSGIIFGAMVADETMQEVRRWVEKREGPALAMSRAVLSRTKFELEIEPQSG